MFFGHLPEILFLLVLALLVFGPKRMMEMGSSLGKAVRELREATKDINIPDIMGTQSPAQSTLSRLSQLSQTIGASTTPTDTPTTPPSSTAEAPHVVDAVVEQTEHNQAV